MLTEMVTDALVASGVKLVQYAQVGCRNCTELDTT